jgi:hypothetical protein
VSPNESFIHADRLAYGSVAATELAKSSVVKYSLTVQADFAILHRLYRPSPRRKFGMFCPSCPFVALGGASSFRITASLDVLMPQVPWYEFPSLRQVFPRCSIDNIPSIVLAATVLYCRESPRCQYAPRNARAKRTRPNVDFHLFKYHRLDVNFGASDITEDR